MRALVLISAFVLLAEVAFYGPALANFHDMWLRDRVSAANTAALVFQVAPEEVPEAAARVILKSAGVKTIVLKLATSRRLLAATDMPPQIDDQLDLRRADLWTSMASSVGLLLRAPGRILQIVSEGPMADEVMEITLDETPLQKALQGFAVRVLAISLAISITVAILATAAVHGLILRPVRRLTSSILAFGANPQDSTQQIRPSGAQHELGQAEEALLKMQATLANELIQRQRLAALGLAVAQVNHDLRNMLAPAQLLSDRLGDVSDPLAQHIAPKLVATLDRAIAFCQSTLVYGAVSETPSQIRPLDLHAVVADALMTVTHTAPPAIQFENRVPLNLRVMGDADQLFRVFLNLLRNAVEAVGNADLKQDVQPRIQISAKTKGSEAHIVVEDTGPGVPQPLQNKLFKAFQGSGRPGGTGLGLAIAADLLRAQGVTIALDASHTGGAAFVITLAAAPQA